MKLGEAWEWAANLVSCARENPQLLSDWQQSFINDYGKKVMAYEGECYVSEKQLEQLIKMANELGLPELDRDQLWEFDD